MNEFGDLLVAEATPVPRVARQKMLLLLSCIMLLVCFPIAVFSWAAAESSTSLLLLGDASGFQIGLVAGMAVVVAFVVLLWNVSSSRWWLIVAIPSSVGAGLILVLAMVLLPLTATALVPIQLGGCETGYVAVERFGGVGNFVGVREGIQMVKVREYLADDFGMPFSTGTASVQASGGEIGISYPGGPGFGLPILETASCP